MVSKALHYYVICVYNIEIQEANGDLNQPITYWPPIDCTQTVLNYNVNIWQKDYALIYIND